ncbi:MAG TPA: serine hydrolase domain-containing protein [Polyangia bacterium]
MALALGLSASVAFAKPATRTRPLSSGEKADALAAGLDPAKLAALRSELEGFVASGEIAGVVAVMGRRGRIGTVQAHGFADLRTRAPMRPSTLFRLEDMTKVATATAVLMLRDEGKLSLEDPVATHLPGFCGVQLRKPSATGVAYTDPPRAVTVADLLRETSGLDCSSAEIPSGAERIPPGPRTLAAAVDQIARRSLVRPPGTAVERCDANYLALGRLIEVASGEPFARFVGKRLFEPLRMRAATFRPSGSQSRRIARIYQDADPGPATKLVPLVPPRARPFADPARGLIASGADHARLLQMLLDGGMARGRRFLRPESAAEMLEPAPGDAGPQGAAVRAGLGLDVVRVSAAVNTPLAPGSFGSTGRLGTHGWVDPQADAVYVVMTQRRDGGGGQAVRLAFQSLGADAIVRRSTEPKPGLFSARRAVRPR